MKVAACISGLPRYWEYTLDNFIKPNILDDLNPDVFIHTWYDENTDYNKLISKYNPKRILIDKDKEIKLPRDHYNGTSERYPAYNIFSFYKSIQQCAGLMNDYVFEQQVTYDWVFRLRFDYAVNRKFKLANMDNTKMYVPGCRSNLEKTVAVDQFALSNWEYMNDYAMAYSWIDQIYEEKKVLFGELVIETTLQRSGLTGDKLEYLDMNHPFGLETGDSMRHSLVRKIP